MSAPTITEAQARERERAAFVAGWETGLVDQRDAIAGGSPATAQLGRNQAARRYPDPEVPRVEIDPHERDARWQYYPVLREFGVAHPDISDGDFYKPSADRLQPTPERVALWADLLARPTQPAGGEG